MLPDQSEQSRIFSTLLESEGTVPPVTVAEAAVTRLSPGAEEGADGASKKALPRSWSLEPSTTVPQSSRLSVPQQERDSSKVTSPRWWEGPGTFGPCQALLPEPCCSPAKAKFQGRRQQASIGPHGQSHAASPPIPAPRRAHALGQAPPFHVLGDTEPFSLLFISLSFLTRT